MALQHLLDATVEAFDYAVDLRRLRRGQAVLDIQGRIERAELVLACGGPLAQTKEPIVKSLSLSVRTVRIRIGKARPKSRRKWRALAAVFAVKMRTKTQRVTR
jgi:hypothetical protein